MRFNTSISQNMTVNKMSLYQLTLNHIEPAKSGLRARVKMSQDNGTLEFNVKRNGFVDVFCHNEKLLSFRMTETQLIDHQFNQVFSA